MPAMTRSTSTVCGTLTAELHVAGNEREREKRITKERETRRGTKERGILDVTPRCRQHGLAVCARSLRAPEDGAAGARQHRDGQPGAPQRRGNPLAHQGPLGKLEGGKVNGAGGDRHERLAREATDEGSGLGADGLDELRHRGHAAVPRLEERLANVQGVAHAVGNSAAQPASEHVLQVA